MSKGPKQTVEPYTYKKSIQGRIKKISKAPSMANWRMETFSWYRLTMAGYRLTFQSQYRSIRWSVGTCTANLIKENNSSNLLKTTLIDGDSCLKTFFYCYCLFGVWLRLFFKVFFTRKCIKIIFFIIF